MPPATEDLATPRYLVRCGECDVEAPLVGESLTGMSDQVGAFQAEHVHATDSVVVERAPVVLPADTAPAQPQVLAGSSTRAA